MAEWGVGGVEMKARALGWVRGCGVKWGVPLLKTTKSTSSLARRLLLPFGVSEHIQVLDSKE